MTKDPPEKKLKYYNCENGDCVAVHSLKCRRVCDYKAFDFAKKNLVLFSGERVVMAKCKEAFINNTVNKLPERSVKNFYYRVNDKTFLASPSKNCQCIVLRCSLHMSA